MSSRVLSSFEPSELLSLEISFSSLTVWANILLTRKEGQRLKDTCCLVCILVNSPHRYGIQDGPPFPPFLGYIWYRVLPPSPSFFGYIWWRIKKIPVQVTVKVMDIIKLLKFSDYRHLRLNYPFDRRIGSDSLAVRWYLTLVDQEEQQGNVQPSSGLTFESTISSFFAVILVVKGQRWRINGHRRQPTTTCDVFRRIRSTTRLDVCCPARHLRHHYGFGASWESIRWFLYCKDSIYLLSTINDDSLLTT